MAECYETWIAEGDLSLSKRINNEFDSVRRALICVGQNEGVPE